MTDIIATDAEEVVTLDDSLVEGLAISKPSRSQRKPVKATREMVAPLASVEPICVDNLMLKTDGSSVAHFWRLKYKGCPKADSNNKNTGNKIPHLEYLDMNRDDLVRDVYGILKADFNISKKTYCDLVILYIRWLDDEGLSAIDGDYFHNDLTSAYMTQWALRFKNGRYSKSTWSIARTALSFMLRAKGRHKDAGNLIGPKDQGSDTKSYSPLDIETELKPTAQALFRAYHVFLKHLNEGSVPTTHPLWDEKRFQEYCLTLNLNNNQKSGRRAAFETTFIRGGDWRNSLARIAMLIIFMLTGMNKTPLIKMKFSDVKFRLVKSGSYIFDATKNRAKYLKLDNGVGINKSAKRFIESWLGVSAVIYQDDQLKNDGNKWLFPYVQDDNSITSFYACNSLLQDQVNNLLGHLGLSKVNASVLRKTKTNGLLRVTEDIYLVSVAANNDVKTISKAYAHGSEKDHERTWAAAGQALFDYAKNGDIDNAIKQAKFDYHDPLDEYDYKKRLRPKNEALTPMGVRCQDNKKGSAEFIAKAIKKIGIDTPEGEKVCTDFLGCFECEHHKLVAAVDDIWLMLSFRDTLEEMKMYAAVNSLPQSRHQKLCLTIDSILSRFKEKDEGNYKQAQKMLEEGSHPLYANLFSLHDLLEIFS